MKDMNGDRAMNPGGGTNTEMAVSVLRGLSQLRMQRENAEQTMRRAALRGDPSDPQTLRNQHDLAVFLARRGARNDKREAFAIFTKVLHAQERVLGQSHPATLRSAGNLARLSSAADPLSPMAPLGKLGIPCPLVDDSRASPRLSARSAGRVSGESFCSGTGSFETRESFESASTTRFSDMSRSSFESKALASPRGTAGLARAQEGSLWLYNSFEHGEDFGCIQEEELVCDGIADTERAYNDNQHTPSGCVSPSVCATEFLKKSAHLAGGVVRPREPSSDSVSGGVRRLANRRQLSVEEDSVGPPASSSGESAAAPSTYTERQPLVVVPPPKETARGMLSRLKRPTALIATRTLDINVSR